MKVSKGGNIEDPQVEDGKKIIEAIYHILCEEWFSLITEQFYSEHFDYYSIVIFWLLIMDFPSEEELTVLLFAKENEYLCENASWSRCEKMAGKIILLRPWVDQNLAMTGNPN